MLFEKYYADVKCFIDCTVNTYGTIPIIIYDIKVERLSVCERMLNCKLSAYAGRWGGGGQVLL